jgi:hypothetical protein
MELPNLYRMRDLRMAFARAGLFQGSNQIYFTTKIRRLERAGRLRVPRSAAGHRQFTLDQIAEIVAAFLPNGSGCYYYRKPSMTQREMQAIKDAVIQEKITNKIKEMEGIDNESKKRHKGEISEAERQQQITKRVSALRKEIRVRVSAHARHHSNNRASKIRKGGVNANKKIRQVSDVRG